MLSVFHTYFHAGRHLPPSSDPQFIVLTTIVHTTNFGDILAGYYTKEMGCLWASSWSRRMGTTFSLDSGRPGSTRR
ncbi:hypothetical protein OE88DRAFT_1660220 [Heliocybe sulcata]|uniref:Uncharacterized protein n=1 Tax=Heliocybe sulcata TaxID=5364 RepID=A0A5C3NB03_9AGAM|nr:hypothetical protein OE88DRAFT_1660220 [Heliocybe sulcata]